MLLVGEFGNFSGWCRKGDDEEVLHESTRPSFERNAVHDLKRRKQERIQHIGLVENDKATCPKKLPAALLLVIPRPP